MSLTRRKQSFFLLFSLSLGFSYLPYISRGRAKDPKESPLSFFRSLFHWSSLCGASFTSNRREQQEQKVFFSFCREEASPPSFPSRSFAAPCLTTREERRRSRKREKNLSGYSSVAFFAGTCCLLLPFFLLSDCALHEPTKERKKKKKTKTTLYVHLIPDARDLHALFDPDLQTSTQEQTNPRDPERRKNPCICLERQGHRVYVNRVNDGESETPCAEKIL